MYVCRVFFLCTVSPIDGRRSHVRFCGVDDIKCYVNHAVIEQKSFQNYCHYANESIIWY